MELISTFYIIFVFSLSNTLRVRADLCTSVTGVSFVECGGGSRPMLAIAPEPSSTATPIPIDPCTDYTYTGPQRNRYIYSGDGPFDITVTSSDVPEGERLIIGNFMCDNGDGTEKCHKYIIEPDANPDFTLKKVINKSNMFTIHGTGTITFHIDNGSCRGACGGSYQTFTGGHQLKLYTNKLNRDDAKKACEADGARLAIIHDTTMTAAIGEAETAAGVTAELIYFGLTYGSFDGTYYTLNWDDGTTLTLNSNGVPTDSNAYAPWQWGLSHDGDFGETCYALMSIDRWDDRPCHGLFDYICECPQ